MEVLKTAIYILVSLAACFIILTVNAPVKTCVSCGKFKFFKETPTLNLIVVFLITVQGLISESDISISQINFDMFLRLFMSTALLMGFRFIVVRYYS